MPEIAVTSTRSHCNECGGEKNHIVLHREYSDWSDELHPGFTISGTSTHFLLKCAGCGSVHLRHQTTFSEDDPRGGPTVRFYPPAISRKPPAWADGMVWPLGSDSEVAIGELLEEIYVALHNDSRRLATMGIRALLEVIMIDKVGDQGTIGKNADKFLAEGFVPKGMHTLFRDTMIEAGHASMHRSYVPIRDDLNVLMDLTELLIAQLYVHPANAQRVRSRIPKRQR